MLSSISPLGERARASRWWLTTAAYVVSSLAGGAVLGLLAGSLGRLVPSGLRGSPLVLVLAAAALLAGLLLDLRIGGTRLPTWRRQVDEAWVRRYRGWVTGIGFGAQLGFGLVTIVTSSTTYAVVVLAALGGSPVAGAVIGGVFGVARALPLVAMARVDTSGALHAVFIRLGAWAIAADRAAMVTLVMVAMVLFVVSAAGGLR